MWELIRANKRNSIILMACMAFVLMSLGFAIGAAVSGQVGGGFIGLFIATAVWLIMMLI